MTVALKLDVKSNIKQFTKGLNKVGKSQIPFTTNETIGNTAFTLRNAVVNEMPRHVDRPTNKTLFLIFPLNVPKKGIFLEKFFFKLFNVFMVN